MIRKNFEQLRFKNKEKEEKIEVIFLDHFTFEIYHEDLLKIGKFNTGKDFIEFDTNEKKLRKLDFLINAGFNNLKSRITGKKTIYVHSNSEIPLIGNGGFGIVDRGSNIIEIKPICGCNLDCIYCSVDENKRNVDFIIEKDYLINELKKVVKIKKNPVEIHIGCQGEPLLYSPLVELIEDCANIPNVKRISMDTNVTLLNPKKVDELVDAGLTQFNCSLNSLNKKKSVMIANKPYNVDFVKKIIRYISQKNVLLVIAPVWMHGVNDDDMEEIIRLCKETNAVVGIQNYLNYSYGKKIGNSVSMEEFYDKLIGLEKKHDIKLLIKPEDFNVMKDIELPKPFKKNEIINVKLVSIGRMSDEFLAVANDRVISVYDKSGKLNNKIDNNIKIRIVRSKHNIYAGEPA